ncbi:60S ribosomal protein L11 [Leishmania tarentolae]|uniref:60S ribosomal protein L11 n=1 Tax=Leishmania tarentolae TaxID=5689 RepID=A0A640K7W3_LEITA|nr:60S ribosomal protein L11 [Leishmania tarentolae]
MLESTCRAPLFPAPFPNHTRARRPGFLAAAAADHLLLLLGLEDDAVVNLLEPLHRLLLGDVVGVTDAAALALAVRHPLATATEDDVEVHAVDTGRGVVLDAEIDVLIDAKAEGAGVREVVALELELLHLEALLQQLLGFLATDCAVHGNLLVTTDAERAHSQASAGEHRGLLAQLLQHLRRTRQAIATLTNANVDAELLHDDLPHGVRSLALGDHRVPRR